jgi:hypothetical protein
VSLAAIATEPPLGYERPFSGLSHATPVLLMQRIRFISIYVMKSHLNVAFVLHGCSLRRWVMLSAIVDFSIIIANLGGVLGLSGLLMLNYVFPSTADGCPAWAKPLFQILAALGAIVVVGVLVQNAGQISPGAWAFAASSPPHS